MAAHLDVKHSLNAPLIQAVSKQDIENPRPVQATAPPVVEPPEPWTRKDSLLIAGIVLIVLGLLGYMLATYNW